MTDQAGASQGFKREALPQDIEPYRQEAQQLPCAAFEKKLPFPFLLYVRSKLWDRALIKERSGGGRETTDSTRMVRYELYEGGYSFLHPIRKRQTNPRDLGIVLGRSTAQDLIVPVGSISSMHASFLPPTPSSPKPLWAVLDNGSSNGTWVNDKKLVAYAPEFIEDGDYLRLGGNLIAYFLYPGRLWKLLTQAEELERLITV